MPRRGQALGDLARWCARRRVGVLVAGALLMGILATGLPGLDLRDDPLQAMPRGHPNTLATENLTSHFPGASYASPVFVSVDPVKWAAADARLPYRVRLDHPLAQPGSRDLAGLLNDALSGSSQGRSPRAADPVPGPLNITDEVYLRGIEEMHQFLEARVEGMAYGITLSSQVKLVNFTNTGIPGVRPPDPIAFRMPATDPSGEMQYATAWNTFFVASPASVRTIVSSDWQSTRLAFLFDPGDKRLDEVGDDLYAAVDAYGAEVASCDGGGPCRLEWNVFDPEGILVDPRGPPAAASHLTRVTVEDMLRLTPVAIVVVGAMLFIAFRRVGTVLATAGPLAVAGFGVLGAFGWAGLPIHSVSLLVFPVLVGIGIDFGIHMATTYGAARQRGLSPEDAAAAAGQGAGPPLVVATVTTLVGMAFLVWAPNDLLRELGLAVTLGLTLLLVVSLTCLPAALTWVQTPPPRQRRLDRLLERNAAFWGRNRAAGLVTVATLAAVSLLAAAQLSTLVVGTPAAYFPESDRQRQDFEESNRRYFDRNTDLVSNVLVLEGPLATPEAMDLLGDLEESVKRLDFVRSDSVVSIRFAIASWIQVRNGTAGAPAVVAQESAAPGSTFPDTEEGVRFLLDEMFGTPLATYATFLVRPGTYDIGALLVEVQQPAEFGDLEALWDELGRTVDEALARHPDAGVRAHLAGATAVAYLFTAEELPYVQVAGLLGLLATGVQVWALRRSLRDALVVTGVVAAAGLWWLGMLAATGIALSIALVVPVVILEAVGSDYALHMRYGLASEGRHAWAFVGRAVLYSALTDIAAFLVFTQMRYGLLRDATIATMYVLGCALVATLVLVPTLARKRELPPDAAL